MTFKAKLRKIGNSIGVLIPLKVITNYTLGEYIELEVITKEEEKFSFSCLKIPKAKEPKKKFVFNAQKGIWE